MRASRRATVVFPVPGIADEHEVAAAIGNRQLVAPPQLLDAREVHEEAHLALHVVEADELVELVEQRVEGRRFGRRFAGESAQRRGDRTSPCSRLGAGRAIASERKWRSSTDRYSSSASRQSRSGMSASAHTACPMPERGLVVRPRVRGAGRAVVLHELFEQRRDLLQELGVARDDVALAQPAERAVRDLRVDRAERAAERDQLASPRRPSAHMNPAASCRASASRPRPMASGSAPWASGHWRTTGCRRSTNSRTALRQDVVVAALRHHPGIIVARAPQT